MSAEQHTALGGTLLRWADNTWAWSDHTTEPRVKDMRPSWYYNFRVQAGMVEVPVKVAHAEPELEWVRTGYTRGLSSDHYGEKIIHTDAARVTRRSQTGKAIPEVYLVSVEEWDEWNAVTSIGAKWDKADEAAILAKAEALGWRKPLT